MPLARRAAAVVLGGGFALFVAVRSAALATAPTSDPDVFWIAAAGRELLRSGHVPTQNVFSYVEPAHAWLMHEWLLGPFDAWGLTHFGPAFFGALAAMTFAAGALLGAAHLLFACRSPTIALLSAFAAFYWFGRGLASPRPAALSLLFAMSFVALALRPRMTTTVAGALVFLELVWTNIHGGFPLGVAIVVVGAVEFAGDRRRRLVTAAACAAITALNPYGLSLHAFVFRYLVGREGIYREINAHVIEFWDIRRAWSTFTAGEIAAGIAVILVTLFAAFDRRYRARASFCALLVAAAMRQVRHYELAGMLCVLSLGPWIDGLWSRLPGRTLDESRTLRARLCALIAIMPALWTGVAVRRSSATRTQAEWIDGGPAFLGAFARIPDGANAYVPFARAGLAIWYGYPRGIRVFYDPRNDCYSAETYRAFAVFLDPFASRVVIRDRLARTQTTAVIAAEGQPITWALEGRSEWHAVPVTPPLRVFVRQGQA